MKFTSIAVATMCFLVSPLSVLAEEQTVTTESPAITNITSETVASGTESTTPAKPATHQSMHEMGMMHKGKGRHGKGDCGMKHDGGQHGKGMRAKHDQVVQRLDMIEARLAKIEAMLESLVRR